MSPQAFAKSFFRRCEVILGSSLFFFLPPAPPPLPYIFLGIAFIFILHLKMQTCTVISGCGKRVWAAVLEIDVNLVPVDMN